MAINDFEVVVRLVIQSTLKTKFHYFQMFLLNNSIFLTDSLKRSNWNQLYFSHLRGKKYLRSDFRSFLKR